MSKTKSNNPEFSSCSFYVPRTINLRFNSAINTLKVEGALNYECDRSDLLSVFMDEFASEVESGGVPELADTASWFHMKLTGQKTPTHLRKPPKPVLE